MPLLPLARKRRMEDKNKRYFILFTHQMFKTFDESDAPSGVRLEQSRASQKQRCGDLTKLRQFFTAATSFKAIAWHPRRCVASCVYRDAGARSHKPQILPP
jgi:hypothetical protein